MGKGGVVKDPEVHVDVVRGAVLTAEEGGLTVRGLTYSPIKGPEGNIEFWMWAARTGEPSAETPESVVAAAHAKLGG